MLQKSVGGGLRDISLKFGASVAKGANSDVPSTVPMC